MNPETSRPDTPSILRRILDKRELGIALPMIILIIVTAIINPVFIGVENVMNILRQTSFVLMMGTTMTAVFIAGGLDLSVGSVLALGGCITGMALMANVNILISIVLGILTGAAVGLFNGVVITRFKIPAIIVTLGTMNIARGLVQFLTRGVPVYPLPDNFNVLGQGFAFGVVPIVVVVSLLMAILMHIVLTKTQLGRAIFAVGGNAETARLSGLGTNRILATVYALNGIAAGIAGIFTAARLGSAQSNAGTGMELQVITAVVIGGTSTFGGSGSILGCVIGALMMSVIANGMVILKISVYLQSMVIGILVIVAVGMDQYNRKRSGLMN